MTNLLTYEVTDGIAVLTVDSPPVNALGYDVRKSIVDGFEKASADVDINAIVLICKGRTFFAGADIREFGTEPKFPILPEVIATIESSPKLTIAALHGTPLGGGLETALACHYRVALATTRVGLPEVKLGLLPGAGGTQKLPRLTGIPSALEIITSGRQIKSGEALKLGIIDKVCIGDDLSGEAIAFAKELVYQNAARTLVSERNEKTAEHQGQAEIYDAFRAKNSKRFRGFKSVENIIKAIQASADLPYKQGLKRERELFSQLLESRDATAQRHVFFAERETGKIPDIPKTTPVRPINNVGIIGAGTMGGGIAMNFLNAQIPVILLEKKQEALDHGISVIRQNYQRSVKGGRMSEEALEACMKLITPSLDYADLSSVDLVIEAVFETMDIKKTVFSTLDTVVKKGCILASNTSYLDINEIAESTSRPQDVIGLHFFSPANIMNLLEVVRGEKSDPEVVNTGMRLAKKIMKTPVLSRVGWGFIANRVMKVRSYQTDNLILQGINPETIDKVIYDYGFAMGPIAVKDLVGLDVIGRDSGERTVESVLVSMERLGQKKNGGYYDYDKNRQRSLSPVAMDVIQDIAHERGI
ncbi:MAG: 3-hydroxyacyl-CoA dehydrogenase, partial [Porticoccaceae bacterium]|nr:3-hydroxyacyl-CoA dehydrogenase [Porticoccaceae bacterium]